MQVVSPHAGDQDCPPWQQLAGFDPPRDEFDRDLSPNHLAGQNLGPLTDAANRPQRSAFDVKPIHRALRDWPDAELKAIPVLEEGTPL